MPLPVTSAPDHELDAIQSLLATWNGEADRFRRAAIAAERGEAPAPSVVDALAEAHAGLAEVLDATDRMIATMRGGSPAFAAVLQLQATASALLESLGTSLDALDQFVTPSAAEPVSIARQAEAAAPDPQSKVG